MKAELSQDQIDLVGVIRSQGSMALAEWVKGRFEIGDDFDAVERALSRAGEVIRPWRIGRGV